MKKILESIGFKVFCTVDKKRKTYKIDHCKINLEDIKGFKPAIELEIIDDKDIDKHKDFMHKIMDDLGIKKKITKSITYLYMKENSFR